MFYSPIVYTPQRGKAVTALYLRAAAQTLPGDQVPSARGSTARARVPAAASGTRNRCRPGTPPSSSSRPTSGGTYVNGVDIIRCNDEGRIVEFRVMIRPLQAVNLVHEQMAATLERMKPGGP